MKHSLGDVRDRDEALRWVVEWLRHHRKFEIFNGVSAWTSRDYTSPEAAEELERLLDRTGAPWSP